MEVDLLKYANNCVLQFGRLVGGEANDSTETIGGCQIFFEVANDTLMFTGSNSSGPVINFYGCLLESEANGRAPFILLGPMRLIGCICDDTQWVVACIQAHPNLLTLDFKLVQLVLHGL